MFLVDDILTFPVRGILWVFQELHTAVQQDMEGQAADITHELTELYMRLETGKITEAEFETREAELLDRLDSLQENESPSGNQVRQSAGAADPQP